MPSRGPRRSKSLLSSESGFAKIMALVVVLIMWLLTVALANLAVSEYATAAGTERSAQAFVAAEAGIERAIAELNADTDWEDNLGVDAGVTTAWTLRYQDVPLSNGSQFSVWLRHDPNPGPNSGSSMQIRAIGEAKAAVRTIEYAVENDTALDIVLYSVNDLNTCAIPGGGSLQFHGSAYIEQDMCLKGGSQAGFYNDRYVLSSDAPDFFNHIYVNGDLDTSTGNPSIGTPTQPYWWLHVSGNILGPSNKIYTANFDDVVPPPFYPDVLEDLVKPAFDAPNPVDPFAACHPPSTLLCRRGNAVVQDPGPPATMRMVICRYVSGVWQLQNSSDLTLDNSIFYLPKEGSTSCATDPVATVRAGGDYMLFWDGTVNPTPSNTNMVFPSQDPAIPDLQIYVPGAVFLRNDVRYEGKGTLVVANQPQATVYSSLQPQSGCAFDFNSVAGDTMPCDGNPNDGRWIRSNVSPCLGSPGTDNPSSTYVSSDIATFIVNGSAFSELNSNACAQEMDMVAIVGDRNATGSSICGTGACFKILKKLQWYGVLMTVQFGLGQVPDFWQMPDLRLNLPSSVQNLFQPAQRIIEVKRWQEIF